MLLDFTKKDIELLFDKKEYSKLIEIYSICSSEEETTSLNNFLNSNNTDMTNEEKKRLVSQQIINHVRDYNRQEQYKEFTPIQKRETNDIYQSQDESSLSKILNYEIRNYIKDYKDKISKDTFITLRQIYNTNKDICYAGLYNIRYDVDNILENGINFGKDAILKKEVKIVKNFDLMIHNITKCSDDSQSNGVLIVKIPKNALDKKSIPIYYEKDNRIYLNPMYIVCYVPVENKKILSVEINRSMNEVESTIYEGESFRKNIINMG